MHSYPYKSVSDSPSPSSYSTITPNSSNAMEISDNAENCCCSVTMFCCPSYTPNNVAPDYPNHNRQA